MKIRTIFVGLLTLSLMIFLFGSLTILAQDKPTDQPKDEKSANSAICCHSAKSNPDCCPKADKSKMKCDPASCDTTACSTQHCSSTDNKCIKASNCNSNSVNCKKVCTGH